MKKQPALEEQSNQELKNQEKDDSYTQNARLRAKIFRDFLSKADMKFAGMLLRNTCEDITPQRRLPEKVNADNDHKYRKHLKYQHVPFEKECTYA